MCVAEPLQLVTSSSRARRSTLAASKRPVGHTSLAPPARPAVVEPKSPDRWNSGNTASVAPGARRGRGSVIMRRAPRNIVVMVKATMLRWLISAPFGRPVVPLVKSSTAGSSSWISTSGRDASGAWSRSAGKSRSITIVGTPGSAPSSRARRRSSATRSEGSDSSSP